MCHRKIKTLTENMFQPSSSHLQGVNINICIKHRFCVKLCATHTSLLRHCRYRGADKSLARPNSRYILFDGENISFDASLVIYINSTNIPPIMIINRIYETQNLLSL